jgi:hypothetical protein
MGKVLVGGYKSKSVCAEHDVGVNQAVFADHSTWIEHHSWVEYSTGTYLNVFGHNHSRSDEHGGVNPRGSPNGPGHLFLPACKDGCPCGIGIRYSYDATLEFFGSLVFGVAEYHAGIAQGPGASVAGVGDEADSAFAAPGEGAGQVQFMVRPFELAAQF